MFRKFVCIYLIVYSSIGSNGPFPLPKYCALPIASLDLIVCIHCLNDLYSFILYPSLLSHALSSKKKKKKKSQCISGGKSCSKLDPNMVISLTHLRAFW